MTFEKGNTGYFIAFIFIGAVLGSTLGTLLTKMFPWLSFMKESLTDPIGFNLEIISFSIKLNLSAIIGIAAGVIVFRKI